MKNIPLFTTEHGAASLILREIPYTGVAYVLLQASTEPLLLLEDCVGFCRACGGEKIYAKGAEELEDYPFHTAVLRLTCRRDTLPETDAALWPVLPENAHRFREIYNERMKNVPNASYMTQSDVGELLRQGDGYFVHRGETLLGIGRASGEQLSVVISVVPGAGQDVAAALCTVLTGEQVTLEVAQTNIPAMKLYSRMGFYPVAEQGRWYRVWG